MCFGILFSIFNNCLKYSTILGHNSRLEEYFNISVFMRVNFGCFLSNFKCKGLSRWRISFPYIEFNITRYFIWIYYFKLLYYSIRLLRRNQSTEKESFFFIKEYIRVYHRCDIWIRILWSNNHLFLKNCLKVLTIYTWNAWFSYHFV